MHFHFSFYSSLLLIFFTHGLLFTVLLFQKGWTTGQHSFYWLAAFTFMCTLNITPWMLGHAGWYSVQPYRDIIMYFPTQHFLVLGPLIFFYTRSLVNPPTRFRKIDLIHFVPGTLYIVYSLFMFIADKLILQQSFFYADGHDRDLDAWYRIAGLLSFSCYLFLSLRYYAMFRQIALQVLSFADDLSLPWIKHFLLAMLAMQAMDLTFFLLFPDWGSFTSKWWYYLIFSVLFYYVAFTAYTSSSKSLFGFRIISKNDEGINVQVLDVAEVGQLVTEQFAATGLFLSASTSADDVQDSEALLALKQKLQDALEVDRVFEDENLTLSGLAGRLNTFP